MKSFSFSRDQTSASGSFLRMTVYKYRFKPDLLRTGVRRLDRLLHRKAHSKRNTFKQGNGGGEAAGAELPQH